MKTLTLRAPAMYADHHVIEVRRLILALQGVTDIYASSYSKTVSIVYDPDQTTEEAVTAAFHKTGYHQELTFPQETGITAYEGNEQTFFRHTTAYAQTGKTVSFAQQITSIQRPLIPCPGMESIKVMEE